MISKTFVFHSLCFHVCLCISLHTKLSSCDRHNIHNEWMKCDSDDNMCTMWQCISTNWINHCMLSIPTQVLAVDGFLYIDFRKDQLTFQLLAWIMRWQWHVPQQQQQKYERMFEFEHTFGKQLIRFNQLDEIHNYLHFVSAFALYSLSVWHSFELAIIYYQTCAIYKSQYSTSTNSVDCNSSHCLFIYWFIIDDIVIIVDLFSFTFAHFIE